MVVGARACSAARLGGGRRISLSQPANTGPTPPIFHHQNLMESEDDVYRQEQEMQTQYGGEPNEHAIGPQKAHVLGHERWLPVGRILASDEVTLCRWKGQGCELVHTLWIAQSAI
jgi:hypothetical protein